MTGVKIGEMSDLSTFAPVAKNFLTFSYLVLVSQRWMTKRKNIQEDDHVFDGCCVYIAAPFNFPIGATPISVVT